MAAKRIVNCARIGVGYAGPIWAKKKLLFVLINTKPRKWG
jgi:hypothetical protein